MSNRVSKPSNGEVRLMLKMLREQATKISTELSLMEVTVTMQPHHEAFDTPDIRDRITDLGLASQNMDCEMTVLWKRTR